ncbi:MAG: ribosomal L7Ae/L30e/S12e/Gadd45 family protein [Clostridia bacterium]|nr:ribosomal L7Ae/L30e/S12e/Gadd45 family protein [Clostridia bacterium]
MTPIFGLLGLACRAGQITLGAEMALAEIKGGRAGLVLLDADASDGTKKKITDACAYRGVPLHMLPAEELSRATGREGRMAAAVKPGKMCQRMLELLA